ncbi:MAG: hypothetical protein AUI10_05000 [Actinobacteria bacterium 13_2_20CM_2_72_6]|nr:MAG: hypothetical protein AUI10_05000 [Actinobacteria bacterium 13_2_20CM_2_72_6]
MNASVKNLIPVAAIASVGFCGLPQPKYSYGATAMLAPPPDGLVVAVTLDAVDVLPAASRALTENVYVVAGDRPPTVAASGLDGRTVVATTAPL